MGVNYNNSNYLVLLHFLLKKTKLNHNFPFSICILIHCFLCLENTFTTKEIVLLSITLHTWCRLVWSFWICIAAKKRSIPLKQMLSHFMGLGMSSWTLVSQRTKALPWLLSLLSAVHAVESKSIFYLHRCIVP